MWACFIENFVPNQTEGVFHLRIEDTDQKRGIADGIENIVDAIKTIGLKYNEGVISKDNEVGLYTK